MKIIVIIIKLIKYESMARNSNIRWIEIHGKIKIWRSTRNLKMMKIKNYEIR